MSITGTHHVAITVSDLEKSLDFYTGLPGLEHLGTVWVSDEVAYKIFGLSGMKVRCAHLYAGRRDRIELYHFGGAARSASLPDFESIGLQHISLKVQDLEAIGKKLAMGGVEFIREPSRLPTGERVAFIRDPDNVILQLIEVKLSVSLIGKAWTWLALFINRFGARTRQSVAGPAVTKTQAPNNGSQ
jgi:glyoxylase I family protein